MERYGTGYGEFRTRGDEEARRKFDDARWRARVGRWLGRLRGGVDETLICFGDTAVSREEWRGSAPYLDAVPVGRIVGSTGRCRAFDAGFRPVCSCTSERWQSVYVALLEDKFLPPVKLYRIDDDYYVSDGNHRVSVSRYRGVVAVEAMVIDLYQRR